MYTYQIGRYNPVHYNTNSYATNVPGVIKQSHMKELHDECILTEKNDTDNDVYRNASTGAAQCADMEKYCQGVFDLSFLSSNHNGSSRFHGKMTDQNDVDYFKINTMSQWFNRKPINITMEVPEVQDYDLTVYDKNGNQVGIATDNGDGTKTVKVPCDWSNSKDFIIKVENASTGEEVSGGEYTLKFEQEESTDTLSASEALAKRSESAKNENEHIKRLHKEQYESLPQELKYTGNENAEELLTRKNAGEILTDAEEAYVKIYGNINDIQWVEAGEQLERLESQFTQALKDNKISLDKEIHISIGASGDVIVTGLSEEENQRVKEIINDQFADLIKNAYLNNSESVQNMTDYEYKIAGYAEELDNFITRASNGQVTLDDLSLKAEDNQLATGTEVIQGLPAKISDLINNADSTSKYYDYKEMLHEVLNYKNQNGTIPRYDVQMNFSNGKIEML